MNPDTPQTPREQLEMRVTALLFGELTAEEAAALREVIARDPQLAALEERLMQTIALVRETAASPAEEMASQPAPLKLSDARREQLLAKFKTVTPKEFVRPRVVRHLKWLIPMSAAAAVMLLLSALLLPALSKAKAKAQRVSVLNNLRQLDGAKQDWALENKASADAVPTMSDLAPYMGRGPGGPPISVAGETYVLGKLNEAPSIEVDPKEARKLANTGLAVKPSATPGKVALTFGDEVAANAAVERLAKEPRFAGAEAAKPAATAATPATQSQPTVYDANVVGYVNLATTEKPTPPIRTTIVLPSTTDAAETAADKPVALAMGREPADARNNRFYTGTTSDDVGGLRNMYRQTGEANSLEALVERNTQGNVNKADSFAVRSGTPGQIFGGTSNGGNDHTAGVQLGTLNGNFPTYGFDSSGKADGYNLNPVLVRANEPAEANKWWADPRGLTEGEKQLVTRTIKVDPNTFQKGLEGVVGIPFGASGDGIAMGGGGGGGGGGTRFATGSSNSAAVTEGLARNYLVAAGVDINDKAGKSMTYDGRTGELTVRGTAHDLALIEQATKSLGDNNKPIELKTEFATVTPNNVDLERLDQERRLATAQTKQQLVQGGGATPIGPLGQRTPAKGVNWTGTLQAEKFSFGNNPAVPTAALPAAQPPPVAATTMPAPSGGGTVTFAARLPQPTASATSTDAGAPKNIGEADRISGGNAAAKDLAYMDGTLMPETVGGVALAHRWAFSESNAALNAGGAVGQPGTHAAGAFVNNGQIDTGVEGTYTKLREAAAQPTKGWLGQVPVTTGTLIGGAKAESVDKVSALGDVPQLGWAFRQPEASTPARTPAGAVPVQEDAFANYDYWHWGTDEVAARGTAAHNSVTVAAVEDAKRRAEFRAAQPEYRFAQKSDFSDVSKSSGQPPGSGGSNWNVSANLRGLYDNYSVGKDADDTFPAMAQNQLALVPRPDGRFDVDTAALGVKVNEDFNPTRYVPPSRITVANAEEAGRIKELVSSGYLNSDKTIDDLVEKVRSDTVNRQAVTVAPDLAGTTSGTHVFQLKNADPADVKQTVSDLFARSQPTVQDHEKESVTRGGRTEIVLPAGTGTKRDDLPTITLKGVSIRGMSTVSQESAQAAKAEESPVTANMPKVAREYFASSEKKPEAAKEEGKQLAALNGRPVDELGVLRQRVDELRKKLNVVDTDPNSSGPGSTLGPRYAMTNGTLPSPAAQPYWEAKAELERLQRLREVMELRQSQEQIEAKMPHTTMVAQIDTALVPKATEPGLWDRVRQSFGADTSYSSRARIAIQRDAPDRPGLQGESVPALTHDPQFIQMEAEAIRSEPVLDKVVAKLKLDEAWGKDGARLSPEEARKRLNNSITLNPVKDTSLLDINVKSAKPQEAADIANAVAKAYKDYSQEAWKAQLAKATSAFTNSMAAQDKRIAQAEQNLQRLAKPAVKADTDPAVPKPVSPPPVPQPEVLVRENAFSTFSLNVSDVSFKLAAATLEKGTLPEPGNVRAEEFINAFDYRDPEPTAAAAVGFAWERAHYPFAHNRDLLRFSLKTAAAGRQANRPLNIVLLLDNSGSMERADRVEIIHEALRVLASQLKPQDRVSVITFSRLARLWVDGIAGNQAGDVLNHVGNLTPEGGTNLEEAMRLAYATALRHYFANGMNRVVLLTDGAANLGNVNPDALKQMVETQRKQGVALDCFGIGWEGYNDDLLEVLSRNGDGRYGFINSADEAATEFAGQLAGALQVAASDVKVQVEFNPKRVTAYRQIGYAKHQLKKEQFRDNTVDAAEIAAAEAGNALYTVEVNPAGEGPIATVRARYKTPGTSNYYEKEWAVPYNGPAVDMERASPAIRLAGTAAAFAEWLAQSPFAAEVTPGKLLGELNGVTEVYGVDPRPKQLETMIRQSQSVSGQ